MDAGRGDGGSCRCGGQSARACCQPAMTDAPRLLIGSHLDTIANAGAFDGVLGVVMGVALVEAMVDDGRRPEASVCD